MEYRKGNTEKARPPGALFHAVLCEFQELHQFFFCFHKTAFVRIESGIIQLVDQTEDNGRIFRSDGGHYDRTYFVGIPFDPVVQRGDGQAGAAAGSQCIHQDDAGLKCKGKYRFSLQQRSQVIVRHITTAYEIFRKHLHNGYGIFRLYLFMPES